MTATAPRRLTATGTVFTRHAHAPAETLRSVEGAAIGDGVVVRTLMVSDAMLMLEIHRPRGVRDPLHRHDDHETVCHLVAGRLRLTIGEETFEAAPGDTWFHPRHVPHWSEALEDSVQIEVKSPPIKTWTSPE